MLWSCRKCDTAGAHGLPLQVESGWVPVNTPCEGSLLVQVRLCRESEGGRKGRNRAGWAGQRGDGEGWRADRACEGGGFSSRAKS